MSMAYEYHSKKNIFTKNNNYKKKSLRPRCAIDQNAFQFPGARPNMADAWIKIKIKNKKIYIKKRDN